MPAIKSPLDVSRASVSAKIRRADGTVEDLGVIAEYRRPWWKKLLHQLFRALER